jgi:hypothetical protein
VEVGGAALDGEGIVAVQSVSSGSDAPVEFSSEGRTARAELPELSLTAGFVPAKDKKKNPTPPQPSEKVVVRLRAERPGTGLLTVRVGPLGSPDTRGSALSGRNVSVEKA